MRPVSPPCSNGRPSRHSDLLARLRDLCLSLLGLILGAPLLAAVSILVRLRLGRPIFFSQLRAGREGELFRIIKFRTMLDLYDSRGAILPDEQRMTNFGALLRRASLDELPELFNVLRGDMSFVGPRPLPGAYLSRYTPTEARRHEVRPGLTGWAQVNGRNATTWEERLALDVWYVDHRSLSLDLKILLRTVAIVIGRKGVSADGHVTMPELRPEQAEPPG